jgi:fatty-acyl-CoA synthase
MLNRTTADLILHSVLTIMRSDELSTSDIPTFPVLGKYLEHWNQLFPDLEAVVFNDRRMTFQQLNETVDRFSKALISLGVRKGDRIVTLLSQGPEFVIVFLGCSRIGAITVPLDIRYKKNEIESLCAQVEPKLIVYGHPNSAKAIGELQPTFKHVEHLIFSRGCEALPGALNLEELLHKNFTELDDKLRQMKNDVREDDDIIVIFTGGTTGIPKGAVLSHKNVIGMGVIGHKSWDLNHSARVLLPFSPSHAAGSTEILSQAIISGVTMVILGHFRPDSALEFIHNEKVTHVGQVPTMYAMEFSLPDFEKYDLSSVRCLQAGGEIISPELLIKILKLGKRFINEYGLTEADAISCTDPQDSPEKLMRMGYVGKPHSCIEVGIVDHERKPLPTMQHGEIAVRGPIVCKGYYRMPDETKACFDNEGWFYTGDIGYLDKNGLLYIAGRKKDIIRTGSYTVLPKEIEDVLLSDPRVQLVGVVGVPDPIFGEVSWAFVMSKQGASIAPEELRNLCADKLADYKVPNKVILVSSLPLTRLGKVATAQLKEEARKLKLAETGTR